MVGYLRLPPELNLTPHAHPRWGRLPGNLWVSMHPALEDIDSARVLRLPGFYNRKYDPPHLVETREISKQIHTPESFSKLQKLEQNREDNADRDHPPAPKQKPGGRMTQSERDWAYARRARYRGDDREAIIAAIASYRRFDKHNPRRYRVIRRDPFLTGNNIVDERDLRDATAKLERHLAKGLSTIWPF
jgi:hypothetical protein